MDFDHLTPILIVLDNGVELLVLALLIEQILHCVVVNEVFLRHAKHLECLLLGHEPTINSKSFRCDYFTATVALTELFAVFFL